MCSPLTTLPTPHAMYKYFFDSDAKIHKYTCMDRSDFWRGFMKKMADSGFSQTQVAKKLDIPQPELSRIVNGRKSPPDPNRVSGRAFYKRLAKLSGAQSPDQLVDKIGAERLAVPIEKSEVKPHLNNKQKDQLNRIFLNLVGAEDALPLLEATLRSYVESVQGFSWIESEKELRKLRRERGL
jgi:transcriptional regulator with XRE-family HTH domain